MAAAPNAFLPICCRWLPTIVSRSLIRTIHYQTSEVEGGGSGLGARARRGVLRAARERMFWYLLTLRNQYKPFTCVDFVRRCLKANRRIRLDTREASLLPPQRTPIYNNSTRYEQRRLFPHAIYISRQCA